MIAQGFANHQLAFWANEQTHCTIRTLEW